MFDLRLCCLKALLFQWKVLVVRGGCTEFKDKNHMCKQVACCMGSFLFNYLPTSLLANMLQSGAKRLEAEVVSTFLDGP